ISIGPQTLNKQPNYGNRYSRERDEWAGLESSPLAANLSELYEVQVSGPSAEPIVEVWRHATSADFLPKQTGALSLISPEATNLQLNNLRTTRQIVNICLGGETNQWSNVKLAEGISRMITGKRVSATFVPAGGPEDFQPLPGEFQAVRTPLLDALRAVTET